MRECWLNAAVSMYISSAAFRCRTSHRRYSLPCHLVVVAKCCYPPWPNNYPGKYSSFRSEILIRGTTNAKHRWEAEKKNTIWSGMRTRLRPNKQSNWGGTQIYTCTYKICTHHPIHITWVRGAHINPQIPFSLSGSLTRFPLSLSLSPSHNAYSSPTHSNTNVHAWTIRGEEGKGASVALGA